MSMQLTIFEHSKTEKRCSKCKEVKPVANFHKHKKRKDGLHCQCISCKKNYCKENKVSLSHKRKIHYKNNKEIYITRMKAYTENNKELITQRHKVYRDNNKELLALRHKRYYGNNYEKIAQRTKVYQESNKEKIAQQKKVYRKQRRTSDPLFRLMANLRTRIYIFCKSVSMQKNWSTIDAMGCNREEFIAYFEPLFTEGMTWENYGAWQVDHIKPISLATTEQQAIQLSHYTNLQPLWAEDNRRKGNKYE